MSILPIQLCPRDTLAGILPLPNELCDKIHWFTKGGSKDDLHKELSTVGSIWRVPSYSLIALLRDTGAVQNGSDLEIHKNGYSIIDSQQQTGVKTLYINNPYIRLYATYLLNNYPVHLNVFRNFINPDAEHLQEEVPEHGNRELWIDGFWQENDRDFHIEDENEFREEEEYIPQYLRREAVVYEDF